MPKINPYPFFLLRIAVRRHAGSARSLIEQGGMMDVGERHVASALASASTSATLLAQWHMRFWALTQLLPAPSPLLPQ